MNYLYILIIYFIVINVIAFITMWYDKRQAIKGNFRVSEKTLFILAIFLGGIGIYLGMYTFRHKTKHLKFTIGIPVVICINIATIIYLIKIMILK